MRGGLCVAMGNPFTVLLQHGISLVLIPVGFSMSVLSCCLSSLSTYPCDS